jgi:hypothetical protein
MRKNTDENEPWNFRVFGGSKYSTCVDFFLISYGTPTYVLNLDF